MYVSESIRSDSWTWQPFKTRQLTVTAGSAWQLTLAVWQLTLAAWQLTLAAWQLTLAVWQLTLAYLKTTVITSVIMSRNCKY